MTLSAVLLAGGESRRMGTEKAVLIISGKPLWERQLGVLRKLHPQEIFVSVRDDPPWRPPDIRLLLDEKPSRGPLSGLAIALKEMRTTHLLALAIDMPLMTGSHLRFLCDRIEPGRGVLRWLTTGPNRSLRFIQPKLNKILLLR